MPASPTVPDLDAHDSDVQPLEFSKRAILAAVVRRSAPHLIEATVIPAVLFYCCLIAFGLGAAYAAALGWSYAAVVRRKLSHRTIPPMLVLGVIGITVRTLVAIISRSPFIYFFQPVLGSVAMAFVFLISVGIGRPIIGKLAGEFWPMTAEISARPRVLRLFRNLTLMWGALNLVSAALTLTFLVTLPLGGFLAAKQVSAFGITALGVFVTVSRSLTVGRREGLAAVALWQPAPAVTSERRYLFG